MKKLDLYKKLQNISPNKIKTLGISLEEIDYIKDKLLNDKLGLKLNFTEIDDKLDSNYILFSEEKSLGINIKDKNNNLLIEGDNYYALKALKTAGIKVDVIYIDPPYNTGKEFIYNDDFANDAKIVGNDDAHKHSKWLSFMKRRLKLAKELLSAEGVIFVSIDDNEQAYLKVLMDEIFGENNLVSCITRKTSSGSKNDSKYIANSIDYILMYKKSILNLNKKRIIVDEKKYNLFDKKKLKGYKLRALEMQGGDDTLDKRPNMGYSIYFNSDINDIKVLYDYSKDTFEYEKPENNLLKKGYKCYRPRMRGIKRGIWRWGNTSLLDGNIVFKNDRVYAKEWMPDFIEMPYNNLWTHFLNTKGTNELKEIFNNKIFDFPKPTSLIKELIWLINIKNGIILDFFAGSGTTGQAVMELNEEDGGDRRFILVTNNEMKDVDTIKEPEKGIARAITRERLFRVINGKGSKNEEIKWRYSKDKKSLINNSLKYLKVKIVHKTDGNYEEIDRENNLFLKEFNKDLSIKDFQD